MRTYLLTFSVLWGSGVGAIEIINRAEGPLTLARIEAARKQAYDAACAGGAPRLGTTIALTNSVEVAA